MTSRPTSTATVVSSTCCAKHFSDVDQHHVDCVAHLSPSSQVLFLVVLWEPLLHSVLYYLTVKGLHSSPYQRSRHDCLPISLTHTIDQSSMHVTATSKYPSSCRYSYNLCIVCTPQKPIKQPDPASTCLQWSHKSLHCKRPWHTTVLQAHQIVVASTAVCLQQSNCSMLAA